MVNPIYLVWFSGGICIGFFIGVGVSYLHNRQLLHLAKMKILADTGRDPMLVEAYQQKPTSIPAPNKEEGIAELNRKIKEQFGDEFEVM